MSDALLIRADASPRIGTGHIMRCLALAQQWQVRKGPVIFVSAETTVALEQRLKAESMETAVVTATPGSIEDAEQTIAHAHACGTTWIVADGYVFGAAWQKRIKDSGLRLLVIDDYGHAGHYHADIVLNQNASADAQLYTHRDASTSLLLGTRYTLLRQEFSSWLDWKREVPTCARKVLISLGGGDPDNATSTAVKALSGLSPIEAVIVVGGSNPNLKAIQEAATTNAPGSRLVVNASNMAELMAWADVAVTAGGTTFSEVAYMGLPAGIILLADNQVPGSNAFEREGVCRLMGSHAQLNPITITQTLRELIHDQPARQQMSDKGRLLVDGRGVERIVEALHH
jgi:UDP-2,4-diacetamido-2,4,6-trideoxy-beta-L-altropyranose hydrolase